MRLSTLCMTAALAIGSVGVACATPINLVQNGDFSSTYTPPGDQAVTPGTPTQLNYRPLFQKSYGEFVSDWTTAGSLLSQHVVWFPSAAAASGTNAEDIDANIKLFGGPRPLLPTSVTDAPGGSFIGMQANLPHSGIQQSIDGLTSGKTYTVSFYWAATQDNIDTGKTTSGFQVSIAATTFDTGTQTVFSNQGFLGTHSTATFAGWTAESFTFVADSTSAMLTFLARGTGFGLPPFALLSDVSLTAVPEPSVLVTFGGGLLGLGLLSLYTRRRERMRDLADSSRDIA